MTENVLRRQLEMLSKEELIDYILSEGTVQASLQARYEKNSKKIDQMLALQAKISDEMDAVARNVESSPGQYGMLLEKFLVNSKVLARVQAENMKINKLIFAGGGMV